MDYDDRYDYDRGCYNYDIEVMQFEFFGHIIPQQHQQSKEDDELATKIGGSWIDTARAFRLEDGFLIAELKNNYGEYVEDKIEHTDGNSYDNQNGKFEKTNTQLDKIAEVDEQKKPKMWSQI
jgi:hypothetical protein